MRVRAFTVQQMGTLLAVFSLLIWLSVLSAPSFCVYCGRKVGKVWFRPSYLWAMHECIFCASLQKGILHHQLGACSCISYLNGGDKDWLFLQCWLWSTLSVCSACSIINFACLLHGCTLATLHVSFAHLSPLLLAALCTLGVSLCFVRCSGSLIVLFVALLFFEDVLQVMPRVSMQLWLASLKWNERIC